MIEISNIIWKFWLIINGVSNILAEEGPTIDYCFVRCPDETEIHFMCLLYHFCTPAFNNTIPLESDVAFRTHVLDLHNRYRQDIASGKIKGSYENKGAKNMHVLWYDMELEYLSTCYTYNRGTNITNWGCTGTDRFMATHISYMLDVPSESPENRGMEYWTTGSDDVKNHDLIDRFRYTKDFRITFFLRIVTAETKYIGCAKAKNRTHVWLYCHYGPAITGTNRSVYHMARKRSEIGSECLSGTNAQYPALCGQSKPVPSQKMWVYVTVEDSQTTPYNEMYFELFIITIVLMYF